MRQVQFEFRIGTEGRGLHEITSEVSNGISESGISTGLATVFCRHTSASLIIQENADPDVQSDLAEFFERQVPDSTDWFRHITEGPDDMTAHIKSALTGASISIPVSHGGLMLGTWQGIFLFEHRIRPHIRKIIVHIVGE